MRLLFRYPGSKKYLAKHILKIIPEHNVYIEVFGGTGILLLLKPESKVEIFNDINEDIVNLFRVIRDEEKFKKFIIRVKFLLNSQSDFNYFKEKYLNNDYKDDIDRAITIFYLQNLAINGMLRGYRKYYFSVQRNLTLPSIQQIEVIHNRIRKVYFVNLDFRELFQRVYNMLQRRDKAFREQVLFYLDPPYINADKRLYKHKFTIQDHKEMLEWVLKLNDCKFIISGYDSELYNEYLKNFKKKKFKKLVTLSVNVDKKYKVDEYLWYNF
ncbi:MAG: DNA adenine methylase [candidate division WOR-3 bacterium]